MSVPCGYQMNSNFVERIVLDCNRANPSLALSLGRKMFRLRIQPETLNFLANGVVAGEFSNVTLSSPAIGGRFDFHVNFLVQTGHLCHCESDPKFESRLRINGCADCAE